jgi:hypothetical protein
MSLTNCRFYEEKYPEVESFVMVNVKQIAEMGAYVKLLEYGRLFEDFVQSAVLTIFRQHRRHDPALRTFPKTYPFHPEAHPCRSQ